MHASQPTNQSRPCHQTKKLFFSPRTASSWFLLTPSTKPLALCLVFSRILLTSSTKAARSLPSFFTVDAFIIVIVESKSKASLGGLFRRSFHRRRKRRRARRSQAKQARHPPTPHEQNKAIAWKTTVALRTKCGVCKHTGEGGYIIWAHLGC